MEGNHDRARMLIELHRPDAALEILATILLKDPVDPYALYLSAFCHFMAERLPLAEDLAKQSCAHAPDHAEYLLLLARIQSYQQHYGPATTTIRAACRLAPESAKIHYFLATILFDQGQYGGALEALSRTLSLDPEHSDAFTLRARIRGDHDDLIGAGRDLERSLGLDPENAHSLATRAWHGFLSRTKTDHQAAFRQALRLDPNDALARYGMLRAMAPLSFWQAWRVEMQSHVYLTTEEEWTVHKALKVMLWAGLVPVYAMGRFEPAFLLLPFLNWFCLKRLILSVIPDVLLTTAMLTKEGRALCDRKDRSNLILRTWPAFLGCCWFYGSIFRSGHDAVLPGLVAVVLLMIDRIAAIGHARKGILLERVLYVLSVAIAGSVFRTHPVFLLAVAIASLLLGFERFLWWTYQRSTAR